ncbi:uncharacterized protein LOC111710774 isoform X3 [Eurytemora carolleeae]|uniref:uncharacterized protein LOC111710774 isoform X3 n=1 Tax=Eurytemora carolleeae TaxID=1294199 RepID=UPI000C7882CF|nr:uncharacterized protein LOC111710774 isoform X3 [Eurytemora carolleeae]|eukprot:XP_023340690.1 uncharacterized protein LOC111710774 isoform X3 [Eurytemora affinis]
MFPVTIQSFMYKIKMEYAKDLEKRGIGFVNEKFAWKLRVLTSVLGNIVVLLSFPMLTLFTGFLVGFITTLMILFMVWLSIVSVIVDVLGQYLTIKFPTSNFSRFKSLYSKPIQEIPVFCYTIKLDLTRSEIRIQMPPESNSRKIFSKKAPIVITFKEQTLYLFPRVGRDKEILLKIILIKSGLTYLKTNLRDEDSLVDRVIRECNILGVQSSSDPDHSMEIMNVLINRLGSKLVSEYTIDQIIRNVMMGKLNKYIGRFFNNYGLVDLYTGKMWPVIKKLGEPWFNLQGLWAKVILCQSSEFIEEVGCLSFTLDVIEYELILIINVLPPPSKMRVWVSVFQEPYVNIKLRASGAKSGITETMNTVMPTVERAILAGINMSLKKKYVYPNMKDFSFS